MSWVEERLRPGRRWEEWQKHKTMNRDRVGADLELGRTSAPAGAALAKLAAARPMTS